MLINRFPVFTARLPVLSNRFPVFTARFPVLAGRFPIYTVQFPVLPVRLEENRMRLKKIPVKVLIWTGISYLATVSDLSYHNFYDLTRLLRYI